MCSGEATSNHKRERREEGDMFCALQDTIYICMFLLQEDQSIVNMCCQPINQSLSSS